MLRVEYRLTRRRTRREDVIGRVRPSLRLGLAIIGLRPERPRAGQSRRIVRVRRAPGVVRGSRRAREVRGGAAAGGRRGARHRGRRGDEDVLGGDRPVSVRRLARRAAKEFRAVPPRDGRGRGRRRTRRRVGTERARDVRARSEAVRARPARGREGGWGDGEGRVRGGQRGANRARPRGAIAGSTHLGHAEASRRPARGRTSARARGSSRRRRSSSRTRERARACSRPREPVRGSGRAPRTPCTPGLRTQRDERRGGGRGAFMLGSVSASRGEAARGGGRGRAGEGGGGPGRTVERIVRPRGLDPTHGTGPCRDGRAPRLLS